MKATILSSAKRLLFASLLCTATVGVSRASDSSETPTKLPEFFVAGERVAALEITVPQGDLRPAAPNLGQGLLAIPGVYAQARATDAMEPNIRGLSLDRVATTLNGIPLVNASPERTNSPVVILGPAAVTSIVVTKALPSVTLGPATTGGRIALETESPDFGAAERGAEGSISTTYNGGRDGVSSQGRFAARSGTWDARATFFRNDLGDYTAADGRVVAAKLDELGASAALGMRTSTHRGRVEILHRRLRHQETVSLPLDGKNTDSTVITASDRWRNSAPAPLEAVTWNLGCSVTDPYITSEDRKAPALTFAQATARSFGAGINSEWRVATSDTVAAGADYARQLRRAVRTTAVGQDFIWPGAVYADAGVFGEWKRVVAQAWNLRLGGRVDDVRSDARDAGRLALGRPIRDQYVTYNGVGAATVARHDHAGAANALAEWNRTKEVSAFVGVGYSVQPAQVMERYRAFLNALGGDGKGGNAVELGNPALRAERNTALEAGAKWRGTWCELEATAYHYRINSFIQRLPIGTTQPPIAKMVVFGYRNIDAELTGGEVGATLKPGTGVTLPITFAVANGRNQDTGVGLSEIPPWEATASVRYTGAWVGHAFAVEIGDRTVGAKSNPAPLDNPLFGNTGGFSVWHLRLGAPIGSHVKLEAGVENLLDHRYTEYLTPPVAPFKPASGNLLPGDHVPAPGRAVWVTMTLTW